MGKLTLKKLKTILAHECSLPSGEDIIVRYINSGRLVDCRRIVRSWSIVSEKNPRSRSFLKSSSAIKQEKARHLQHHYRMIHPFSMLRAYWEFFMMFVLILGLIIIPVDSSAREESWYLTYPKIVIDCLFMCDCVMTFWVGYYQNDTKKIILDSKKVAM